MGLGDPKPPMLGDDMPGILNRDLEVRSFGVSIRSSALFLRWASKEGIKSKSDFVAPSQKVKKGG